MSYNLNVQKILALHTQKTFSEFEMARNVHAAILSASPQNIQMSKDEVRQKQIEKVSYFQIVHVNSIKWPPDTSNSVWRRAKDILEYKKEVLSLRKRCICKIPDWHVVEAEVNYTPHW